MSAIAVKQKMGIRQITQAGEQGAETTQSRIKNSDTHRLLAEFLIGQQGDPAHSGEIIMIAAFDFHLAA